MNSFTDGEYSTTARTHAAGLANPDAKRPGAASITRGGVRWPWLVGGVLCVLGALAMVVVPWVLAQRPAPLERYGQVPAFELTDAFGEPFSSDQLAGKVWVANFMFTSCPSICPVMGRHMSGLQAALRSAGLQDGVALVSFSVDPQRDTPEVLREYAAAQEAEPGFWHLLTGEREPIWTLSKEGFKLSVSAVDDPVEPIAHTGKLVLVDQAGVIRGYYDGLTPAVIETLRADVAQLVSEAR